MKKIFNTSYIPLVLVFLFVACFDDKGNYDYTDLKDAVIDIPEVTANNGKISRDGYTELTLTPDIKFNMGAKAEEFDFEWSIFPQSPKADEDDKYESKKVIGNEQNLSWTIDVAPGDYYLVLRVTHKVTKAVTDYKFEFAINTITGWVVYDEKNGEGDLHVIRDSEIVPDLSEEQTGVVYNCFSGSNDGKKLSGGKFLSWRNMDNSYDHIFVWKEDGFVKLEAKTYEVVSEDYSTMFYTQPSVYAPMCHYYENPAYGRMEFLMNNNELYIIKWNTMGQTEKYSMPLSVFGMATKFAPFIAPVPASGGNTNRAVLYDPSGNGGFRTIANNGSSANYPSVTRGVYNPLNMNESGALKLNLIAMEQGRDGTTCAVFRNEKDNNHPWLYTADFRLAASPLTLAKYDLANLENIDKAKLFVFGNRGDVMFYSADNQVYAWTFGGAPKAILPSESGNVTAMKLYTHSNNEEYTGRILFVATYDGNEGKVYKITFNELNGAIVNTQEFKGFGKVIDMIIKE